MITMRRAVPAVGGVLVTVSLIAGCGSSSGSGGPAGGSAAASAAAPTSSPSASGGQRFGGQNSAEFAKIRQCLQAAGISLPTPSVRPSFSPGQPRPSRSPGQPRPSRSPGQGGFGAGRGMFNDPKVQAALKACGITLPSPGSFRRGASPTPSA
jgi:hypothetical protein